MKGSRIALLAVLAGTVGATMTFVPTTPAQAAGPYTIAVTTSFVSVARQSFDAADCNPAIADSPLNGTDARIVDGRGFAGNYHNVSWSAQAVASPFGRLTVFFYSDSCGTLLDPTTDGTIVGPNKTVFVPHGTRWIVVENFVNGPVTFHIN